MKQWTTGLLTLVVSLAIAGSAFAQGGGASSTGTIQGRVVDAQGAVLPGVTVTTTSPSALGAQTTVTSETGNYRFPALPPGTYTVTYELTGFNIVKREGIQLTLGFTATLNIELALATVQETVTVTGESPIIDTTNTRVQQNFKLEQLQSIPNGRDMWSLLAVTPAVQMERIDVGGNRAGTQTDYVAYGFEGQVRVLIEGINTTEGTGGAGFYFDYSSLEEVFMGTTGQTAEMPNPGVQSQFIAKSGGNQFSGEYYLDWYNNAMQGGNIPSEFTQPGAFNGNPLRAGSNEMQNYYDTAINVGGPIKRDKIWWFGTYRTQENKVEQPSFTFDQTFDTKLWNPVVKGTYQVNQNNKLIGYYQWGQKIQPTRLPFSTYTYNDLGATNRQDSGSWVWKGEWNGTISDKLYVETRFGDFGYYFPQITNGDADYFFRDTGSQTLTGSHQRTQNDRDRKQLTGAATYFMDTARGSHTFKFGGEILWENQWQGFLQNFGGNIDHQYANGRPDRVVFFFPTATDVGSLSTNDEGHLLSRNAIDQQSLFVTDTWNMGRLTATLGVRWDRYNNFHPEQRQLAGTFANVPDLTIQDLTFEKSDLNTFNAFAPRAGVVYDLTGDGRTVIKANYGLYWHNPGVGLSSDTNPNQSTKSITFGWNDANGDRVWQPGEQTNLIASALQGAISMDPDLKQPYSHEFGVFFERQLSDVIGSRVGYVYKTEDDLFSRYLPGRGIDAYTVPFSFVDIGVDGQRGTADDQTLTLLGVPAANANTLFPVSQVIMNTGALGRYKTIEASISKRYSNRWSATIGGSYSMRDNFPVDNSTTVSSFPNTPNNPGRYDRTFWDFKVAGSYDAAYGIRISPVLRHQSGQPYAREISVPASAAAAANSIFAGTIYADEPEDNRQDNIWVFDIRAEKTLNLGSRLRLRGFLDLFNIANSHAAETISVTTGTNFQRPSAILAPRTARVGFRFMW